MEIVIIRYPTDEDWARCLLLARETQGKEGLKVPSSEWREKMIRAEHSPMRTLMFTIEMRDIPYFSSVHFVRHKFGVEHYVKSQRVNPERGGERQDALVNHIMDINAQALINMARKRLCTRADPVTRSIMEQIKAAVTEKDPIIGKYLVPDCVYRGGCFEFKSCGYYEQYLKQFHLSGQNNDEEKEQTESKPV